MSLNCHSESTQSRSGSTISKRLLRHGAVLTLLVLALNGCAAMARPTVYPYPQRGQTAQQQTRDRAECEAWAKNETGFDSEASIAKGVGTGAVLWGLVGAAAGAAAGAAVGRPDIGAAFFAALFGISGAAGGGLSRYKEDKDRFNRAHTACMVTRGYEVR